MLPAAAHAQGGEGGEGSGAETPAQALQKAAPRTADPAEASDVFGGGLFRVTQPTDDLSEPVPVGTRAEFERVGYEVTSSGQVELFVDQAGQIYVERPYQGVIPGLRDALDPWRFQRMRNRDLVCWVGFQRMSAVSRVFWLLTDPAPRFEVTRLSDTRLEVFFPGHRVTRYNELRPLITEKFSGPIANIDGRRVRGGIRYIVDLKRPANYLYRFEDPFLYLDVEMDAQ